MFLVFTGDDGRRNEVALAIEGDLAESIPSECTRAGEFDALCCCDDVLERCNGLAGIKCDSLVAPNLDEPNLCPIGL